MVIVLTARYNRDLDETTIEWRGGDMSSLQQADVLQDLRRLLDDEYEAVVGDFFCGLADHHLEFSSDPVRGVDFDAVLDRLLAGLTNDEQYVLLDGLISRAQQEFEAVRHVALKEIAKKMDKHPVLSQLTAG